jgi:hypothetical protein
LVSGRGSIVELEKVDDIISFKNGDIGRSWRWSYEIIGGGVWGNVTSGFEEGRGLSTLDEEERGEVLGDEFIVRSKPE